MVIHGASPAAMVTYAYGQIEQARAELARGSG